ncbi:hypothetical protein D9756_002217 [Leucocoprinus leucothites]|uniref:Uncharacterized protein n=1 Tax=Leucocoprinus leucothites TaxID=201217 RepID=A0A8H5LLS0_9AGAR|nr:hypothetical protein D9756_002217 [Leucoagaricus leucothites]
MIVTRKDAGITSEKAISSPPSSPLFFTSRPERHLSHSLFPVMYTPYKPQGLHGLPPSKSKITGEELRFTSLAGQSHGTAHAPFVPPASMMPLPPLQSIPPPPLTHTPSAPWVSGPLNASSGGLMSLDGFVAPHVSSSSNAYVRRDFPEGVYLQVKRHVNDMVEHPYEETLRLIAPYKVAVVSFFAQGGRHSNAQGTFLFVHNDACRRVGIIYGWDFPHVAICFTESIS